MLSHLNYGLWIGKSWFESRCGDLNVIMCRITVEVTVHV